MRQFRTYGSVRGAAGNRWPYRAPPNVVVDHAKNAKSSFRDREQCVPMLDHPSHFRYVLCVTAKDVGIFSLSILTWPYDSAID